VTAPGGIRIPITADARGFEADLSRVVISAMRKVQLQMDARPLTVPININFDDSTVNDHLRELQTRLDAANLGVEIAVDLDATGVTEHMRAVHADLEREARPITQQIRVEVDQATLSRAQSAAAAGLRAATPSGGGTSRLRGDADASTAAFQRLGSAIGSIAPSARSLGIVTGVLAGIVPAAGAAAGAVGGLAVALAAIGPAAGGIMATAVVGLNGFKDAIKAANDASEHGPKEALEAADKSRALADAQDRVSDSAHTAQIAQRSLTSAQREATQAADDVGRAYRQAGRDLEDAMLRARGATISQKEAAIDLREATKQAQQSVFNPAQHEKDLVALERAQLRYDQAVDENTRAQQDNAEAQKKGIEGSDAVTAAKDKQQQAEQRLADAQYEASIASRDAAKAVRDLAAEQAKGTTTQQAYAEAMSKLSPNAQEFVRALVGLKPAMEGVKNAVQDAGFAGLGATLTDVSGRVLPVLQTGMVGVATQFNGAAKSALDFLGSARGLQGLTDVFQGATNLMAGFRMGTGEATQGLLDFVHVVTPALVGIGQQVALIGDSIGAAFSDAAKSGLLDSVLDGFAQTLSGIGPLLGNFTTALLTIADRVLPSLGPMLEALGQGLVNLAPGLGDLGAAFADALTPILPQLGTFIGDLAEGLAPILPVISNLLSALMTALTPMIGPLSQIVQVIGNALVGAVNALAPAMGPLAQAFADLLTAVAPIVPLIAENLSVAIQALAPALSTVFQALAPVIQSFAQQMQPVIQQLAPVLAQVAMTLGQAFANALQELAPYLPQLVSAFANLLLAVIPLLPQLVDLAVQVMPGVIDILKILLPVITDIINAFTWFVTEVVQKLLLPALRLITDDWQTMNDFIGKGVDWLTDTLFPKIGDAIDKVKGWFDDGVKGIRTIWDGLKSAAADPVRFVIGTVWNGGLLKAWNAVAGFLPGLGELKPVELAFARGGGVNGPGSGTSDDILAYLSNGEHVVTAREVIAAGGQNVLYAIRDMIARGIPFTWDNGKIVTDLGRDNLDRYGAAVAAKGIGNVSPEGLFDQLQPRFAQGGAVEPWMYQLLAGHNFAREQSGKPYQWAGPRFVGDSFDCSGFMGSVAAAILGLNPWQRYWSTSSFAGYPQTGPMGFTSGPDAGFTIGVTDDPGGPGGGHTAGVLGAIPLLGIATAMRAESGGALGDVHYGAGTDPTSFASIYHLPIGANGYFQPGAGGGSVGPSVSDQHGFLARKIADIVHGLTEPIRRRIDTEIGAPPPQFRKIPGEYLGAFENGSVKYLTGLADGLTDGLSSAWTKAKSVGSSVVDAGRKVLDFVTPFDSGGLASGTGFMPKNVIAPERVLSPEQTRLFDAMVMSLQQIAGGSPGRSDPDLLTNAVFTSGIDVLSNLLGVQLAPRQTPEDQKFQEQTAEAISQTGQVAAQTRDLVLRSESSQELVTQQQTEQLRAVLTEISNRLTGGVLTPIMQSAFDSALGVVKDWLGSGFGTVVDAANATTAAVNNLNGTVATTPGGNNPGPGAVSPFGAPGSAFDAVAEISKAVQSVAQAATSAFQQVAQQVANAALAQQDSKVQNSRGTLGKDISGGPLVDMIVRLTGVNIEIRDNLVKANDEIRRFRGDQQSAFDATGRIVADTADLMQRNESSRDLVIQEMNRLNTALMKAVLRYLITAVLIPILTAILSAMIQLVVTAIGAAIGSIIPGIGTAIGAAIGAVVGAALAGLAAVVVSGIAVGAGAAIDSFDEGGIAYGKGYMPKDTISPERVLSPRQTESFDRLVAALENGGRRRGNTTVNAPIHYVGSGGPVALQDHLLSLL
jgi:phage-related protein